MALHVGFGYDVHRRAQGRLLVLGGVRFQTDWGLLGHSDADVLSHAIGDALLGAVALGDLGTHFPPSDQRWKDASSLELLRIIRSMLDGVGAEIVNIDASVIAEEPKIAPSRDEMRMNLARVLRIGDKSVSVKATTHETIGSIGRREGIAAAAVAMVEVP
jgi:2-C-methyl-D-erythritol 2,4-cyclodiphosphate synthase